MTQQTQPLLAHEMAVEQAHVDLVYAHLADATTSAKKVARHGQALYQTDRADFLREEDGTALFERDAFAYVAARRLAVLEAEHEGLVFGRLDTAASDTSYIGRIGVRDAEYEPLVIDWRAPAAEPFYRATASRPMGIVRRRVLRCRGERVVGIEDDLLDASANRDDLPIVGEGALMASLSRARGHTMRDIVATIQAEQDEAIRAPYQGVTIIAGGPGTGKTVVALHRAAYLLYSNRARFERGGILVVGPGPVFMNYIERVLPSLGEDSVTLRAIGAVASDVVDVVATRVDEPAAAAVKGSLRMLPILNRLVAEPTWPGPGEAPSLTVTIKGNVLRLTAERLASIRRRILHGHKANQGRGPAQQAVTAALYAQLPADLDFTESEFDDLVDHSAITRFCDLWWAPLDPRDVLRRLADPDVAAHLTKGVLNAAEQAALVSSFAEHSWSVADAALLDEIAFQLGPVPPDPDASPSLFLDRLPDEREVVTIADRLRPIREVDPHADAHETYAHLLIDEAQDITPMQWRMLRRRGDHASWTIVGDPAQSSWPDVAETEQALTDLIGHAPHRRFRLSTNYRSPAEVFDLAARVVLPAFPEADLPVAVRSTGIEPILDEAAPEDLDARLVAHVDALAQQVEGTIGVVAPTGRLASVRAALAESAQHLADRLVVVSPLEAKGLEYDAALVLAPDEIVATSPGGVRVLYVALTRPTQRLVTLDVGSSAWRRSLSSPSTGSA